MHSSVFELTIIYTLVSIFYNENLWLNKLYHILDRTIYFAQTCHPPQQNRYVFKFHLPYFLFLQPTYLLKKADSFFEVEQSRRGNVIISSSVGISI